MTRHDALTYAALALLCLAVAGAYVLMFWPAGGAR